MFFHGLANHIKDEIYVMELPETLDDLIDLAIKVDYRLQLRGLRKEPRPQHPISRTRSPEMKLSESEPEPKQKGRCHLTVEERDRHRTEGLCMYCGVAGHFVAFCPAKSKKSTMGKSLLVGEIMGKKESHNNNFTHNFVF